MGKRLRVKFATIMLTWINISCIKSNICSQKVGQFDCQELSMRRNGNKKEAMIEEK